jgi:hypothetical protein
MIQVAASARRTFTFPAELPIAYAYYGDVGRVLTYLPHICMVRAYGPDRFRLLYNTTELATYHIRIFADVQTTLDRGWVIRVRPLTGIAPVEAESGINSTAAQGYFTSRSVFQEVGDQCQIEYSLQLRAKLPKPLGVRFMPGAMIDRIAKGITSTRMREISDGFIERSIAAFPHWLDEMKGNGALPGWQDSSLPDTMDLEGL